ncbi:fumarylacetoacetate hydrolase family protein [Enemella sp. A6]|uniref:fumarylacetoacetate hydrolase family protein n=1 Tax=Enemella sp. A6 TaxID=3440152 RepID=UPI003EBF1CD7
MRIARFSAGSDPQYGVVELPEDGQDHPNTIAVLTGDPLSMPVQLTGERHDLEAVRLLAPVLPRSKVIAVGRNYVAHAEEMGSDIPEVPLTFFKPNTAIIGPGDPVIFPPGCTELSYEGELAVVIGRICKDVPIERVPEVIFGYTIANDMTARDFQRSDGQWARAKGFDTSLPLGPWIITHLSLEEAGDVYIRTTVDGEERQSDSTKLMVRSISDLVSWISEWTTLLPGDLILTGTPAGVGPVEAGQEVSVTIEGMGTLTNPVLADDQEGKQ